MEQGLFFDRVDPHRSRAAMDKEFEFFSARVRPHAAEPGAAFRNLAIAVAREALDDTFGLIDDLEEHEFGYRV